MKAKQAMLFTLENVLHFYLLCPLTLISVFYCRRHCHFSLYSQSFSLHFSFPLHSLSSSAIFPSDIDQNGLILIIEMVCTIRLVEFTSNLRVCVCAHLCVLSICSECVACTKCIYDVNARHQISQPVEFHFVQTKATVAQ